MNYIEAQKSVQNNQHLIGTLNEKGFEVSELIIVPAEQTHRDAFIRLFMMNRDAVRSIQPFKNEDVEVWGIDTKHLFMANVLFYKVIDK